MGKDNIETMDRHQLRDLLLSLQEKIAHHFRSGRRSFDMAMKYDRQKSKVEERLQTLEDFPTVKPKNTSFPPDLS